MTVPASPPAARGAPRLRRLVGRPDAGRGGAGRFDWRLRSRSYRCRRRASPPRARSPISRAVSRVARPRRASRPRRVGQVRPARQSARGRTRGEDRAPRRDGLAPGDGPRRAARHHHRQPPERRDDARAHALAHLRVDSAARDVVRAAAARRAHGVVSRRRVSGHGKCERHASVWTTIRYLALPSIALALPIAASLERLQSRAMQDALAEPSVRAALARGCSVRRVVWRHALRLSLTARARRSTA